MRISAVGNPDIGRWTQEFGEANYKGSNYAFVVVDTISLSAENLNINGEAWKFIEKIGKRVIYHLRPQSFDAMLVFFDVLIALFLNRGADRAAHP